MNLIGANLPMVGINSRMFTVSYSPLVLANFIDLAETEVGYSYYLASSSAWKYKI